MHSAICNTSLIHFSAPLIGRISELSWVKDKLNNPEVRIITVTGPVGIGKSSLALTAMEESRAHFSGGLKIVDFEGLCPDTEDLDIVQKIDFGSTLKEMRATLESLLPPVGNTSPQKRRPDGQMLLVMEGAEEIFPQLRTILPPLLAARPNTKVMMTAPMPISVYGEESIRLNPLPLPEIEDLSDLRRVETQESVQLFVKRAKGVRSDFELTPENHESVVRVCQHTGGIPLAIEIAASKVKIKTAKDVAGEIEKSLEAFSRCQANTLSRHESIREAMDWLLTFSSQGDTAVLEQISVFRSGVDLPTIAEICNLSIPEAEERVARLVDISLLRAEDGDDQIVFSMSELCRRYFLEQMRETDMHRSRNFHAHHNLKKMEILRKRENDVDYVQSMCESYSWSEDIRSAILFFRQEGLQESALRLAIFLGRHGFNGTYDVVPVLRDGLATDGIPEDLVLDAKLALGRLLVMVGDIDEASCLLKNSQKQYAEQGDRDSVAVVLRLLGAIASKQGNVERAEELLRRADAELADSGDAFEQLLTLRDLTLCLLTRGAPEAAKDAAVEARELAEQIGCRISSAIAECVFSSVLLTEDVPSEDAMEGIRTAIKNFLEEDVVLELIPVLERLALHLVSSDEQSPETVKHAVVIAAGAAAQRSRLEDPGSTAVTDRMEEVLKKAWQTLGPRQITECCSAGQTLSLRRTVALALAATAPPEQPVQAPLRAATDPVGDGARSPAPLPKNLLSARELQVAELVSRGETNQVIAKRLHISKWTAVNHVRKIMRKLDLSSRTEVAIWFEKST